ncbi:MAG: ROK family protein [Spirochaetia bacterium]
MGLKKESKQMNLKRFLRLLWIEPGLSRIEIAERLELDKSTITYMAAQLIKKGLIVETSEGEAGPQGGRKPVKLTLVGNAACVGGVEMQPDGCRLVLINLLGSVCFEKEFKRQVSARSFQSVFEYAVQILQQGSDDIGIPLLAVTLGVSGIVNPLDRIIIESNPLGIREPMKVKSVFAEEKNIAVYVDNDANCCAWGELAIGRDNPHKNLLFIMGEFREKADGDRYYSGIAIGVGIVINRSVYYGQDFSAGEFRSILWQKPNKSQFSLSDEETFHVKENDSLMNAFISELSNHVAFLVNMLNTEIVFLGGTLEDYSDRLIPQITEKINHYWPYGEKKDCIVVNSTTRDQAVSYGAAGMLLKKIFHVPQVELFDDDESGLFLRLIQ